MIKDRNLAWPETKVRRTWWELWETQVRRCIISNTNSLKARNTHHQIMNWVSNDRKYLLVGDSL